VWTEADAAAMRDLLGQASARAGEEALTALAAAMYAQGLRIATRGAPF
jgi:hypothetical protein